jgi:hypothetical protein
VRRPVSRSSNQRDVVQERPAHGAAHAGRAGRAAQAPGTHTRRAPPPRPRPSPRPRSALRGVARSLALRALGALPFSRHLTRSFCELRSGHTRAGCGRRAARPDSGGST